MAKFGPQGMLVVSVSTTVQRDLVERESSTRLAEDQPHAHVGRLADACRAGAGREEHWFAQLRLVLSFKDATGAQHRLAFLRWLSRTGDAQLRMLRLTWAKQGPAGGPQRAWYDCQDIDRIERPVFLQPDQEHQGYFYYNHFMGCAACRPAAASKLQCC